MNLVESKIRRTVRQYVAHGTDDEIGEFTVSGTYFPADPANGELRDWFEDVEIHNRHGEVYPIPSHIDAEGLLRSAMAEYIQEALDYEAERAYDEYLYRTGRW